MTSGANGSCSTVDLCTAGAGYDGPTGVGSISGDVVAGAPGIGGAGSRCSPATPGYVEDDGW